MERFSWDKISRILRVIEVAAIVIAAIAIPVELARWNDDRLNHSFDLAISFEEKLFSNPDWGISTAIAKSEPVLKESGKFTIEELDHYLTTLSSIEDAYYKGRIDIDTAYSYFSTYVVQAVENPEVRNYLASVRKGSPYSFGGLEEFAQELRDYETE